MMARCDATARWRRVRSQRRARTHLGGRRSLVGARRTSHDVRVAARRRASHRLATPRKICARRRRCAVIYAARCRRSVATEAPSREGRAAAAHRGRAAAQSAAGARRRWTSAAARAEASSRASPSTPRRSSGSGVHAVVGAERISAAQRVAPTTPRRGVAAARVLEPSLGVVARRTRPIARRSGDIVACSSARIAFQARCCASRCLREPTRRPATRRRKRSVPRTSAGAARPGGESSRAATCKMTAVRRGWPPKHFRAQYGPCERARVASMAAAESSVCRLTRSAARRARERARARARRRSKIVRAGLL